MGVSDCCASQDDSDDKPRPGSPSHSPRLLFALADLLAHDPEEVVQAAVGGFVRESGKRDPVRLRAYLDRHVPGLPATIVRHATRHLPEDERQYYRKRAAR